MPLRTSIALPLQNISNTIGISHLKSHRSQNVTPTLPQRYPNVPPTFPLRYPNVEIQDRAAICAEVSCGDWYYCHVEFAAVPVTPMRGDEASGRGGLQEQAPGGSAVVGSWAASRGACRRQEALRHIRLRRLSACSAGGQLGSLSRSSSSIRIHRP